MNIEYKALQNIENRKAKAEQVALDNLAKLREDKAFYELESLKIKLGLEIAKKASRNEDLGTLRAEYSAISDKLSKRLEELGYSIADLSPQYSCTLCNDSGFFSGEECRCLKQEKFNLLKQDTNIFLTDIDSFSEISLANVHIENVLSLKTAYAFLGKFVSVFPVAPKSHLITLIGPVGCGKTYAASVVANAINKKGFSSYLIPSYLLADYYSRYHFAYENEKQNMLDPIIDPDLLIIDDLGTEETRMDLLPGYLYQLLCHRSEKFTIITTNYRMDTIQTRYGSRIHSRLADRTRAKVIELNGRDLRLS